jgi:hypothetical protein
MSVSDFLCDFCGRAWDGAFPMVEGHQGSLICGGCLSVAWLEVGVAAARGAPAGAARRSHRATALDGFMIKATVVIIESIRRNDQEVHAQAAKPFEHWHGLLQ